MPLPKPFADRILKQFPAEGDELLRSLEGTPPTSVRMNRAKMKRDIFSGEKVPWCPDGIYLKERPSFALDPLFHAGAYYVQEASSMILEQVYRRLRSESDPTIWNVLDLCAAPGGKSTHLLSLMGITDVLVSNETIKPRNKILQENLLKWGYPNQVITCVDPQQFSKTPEVFDLIWADVPCSGEGMFRKDKGAIGEWSEANLQLCEARQKRILEDVWPALKPGGFLVYSTCTFNPGENEEQLSMFLQANHAASLPMQVDANWGVEVGNSKGVHGLRMLPNHLKGEGLFVSVIQKAGTRGGKEIPTSRFVALQKEFRHAQKDQVVPFTGIHWFETNPTGSGIGFASENTFHLGNYLGKHLHVLSMGTNAFSQKGKDWIPEHALAMSINLDTEKMETLDLDENQALKYLRKETNGFPDAARGWVLITHKKVPLGWIKGLGNRINNYYPVEWRLRVQ
jgi:16S rRNA C967 or C1407 C5-methylase (RsmB/RsmF family)/NOL1/NOP2/fmu family ribosome biogenesis protein